MPTNRDVRVRLSAEGQSDVIDAFRRIQAETDKANRSAKSAAREGFNDLKEAAKKLAVEYLALESAMKVFDTMKRAVETSIEYATGIEKAAQKTGFAAETLQVYGLAAKQIGIDQEVVTKGLIKFQKSMGDLESGSVKAKNAIKELFGKSDALKGMPDEARLNKVTEALAKMEPGAKRTSIAIALFGKAGAELLPVIDNLGAQGFENLKKKLEDFGLALDEQGIQRMRQAEASFADMQIASKGLQMQFTQGLVPALSDISEGFAMSSTEGKSAAEAIGEGIGRNLKILILFLGSVEIGFIKIIDKASALGRFLASRHPVEAYKTLKEELAGAEKNADDLAAKLLKITDAKPPTVLPKAKKDPGDADSIAADGAKANAARERLLKARLEFTQSVLSEELAVYKETAKLEGEQEKAQYDAGLESIQAYFAKRGAAIAEDNEREAAMLVAKRDALASSPKSKDAAAEMKLQQEIAEVESKIQILKTQGAEQSLRLAHEEADAQKKNAQEVLGFEEKILIAQGKRHEAEARKIDEEVKKYAAALKLAGVAEDEIASRLGTAGGILRAENDFEELKRKVEEGLASMEEARARIQDLAARHVITQGQAAIQLRALDEARLPPLKALVAQMAELARLSGNADLVKAADDWTKKIENADKALEKVKTDTQKTTEAFEQGLGKSLNTFFTTGITHAKSFGDAVRSLGTSVVQDMQKMFLSLIENMIKAKLAAKLTGGGDDGGGDDGGGLMGFLSGMMGKAEGGPIDGPGGTDNVPAWLTRGEFVVRESVARQPGMKALLSALNEGLATPTLRSGRMGFAQGGVVEGGVVAGRSESRPESQMTVGLDYGLVLKHISAHPDFGRVIVKHLDLNRKSASAALGIGK
jgi:hypothetical protein